MDLKISMRQMHYLILLLQAKMLTENLASNLLHSNLQMTQFKNKAYQDTHDNKIKLNAQVRKTRNPTSQGASSSSTSFQLKQPFPHTMPSIAYDNQSNSAISLEDSNQDSKLSLKAQNLLHSLTSADPYQHQSSDNSSVTPSKQQIFAMSSNSTYIIQDPNLTYTDLKSNNVPYKSTMNNQSHMSQSFSSKKSNQVTERLLAIGKIYDAKKQKLREDFEYKKKAEEDNIVKEVKRKYSKENFNEHNTHRDAYNQPVEQRLNDFKKKYTQNALQRQKQKVAEEIQQVKSPQINQKSEKLVQKKQEFKMKVEDRLIGIGQMWKEKKDNQLREHIQEIDSRAYPVITTIIKCETERNYNQSLIQNHHKDVKDKNFEERLKEHMEKKELMLYQLKKKYDAEQNQNQQMGVSPSLQSLDKRTIDDLQNEFQMRQQKFVEKSKKKIEDIQNQEHTKWSFTPQINEKSKKMIQSTSKDRLLARTPRQQENHSKCKQDRFSKSPGTRKDSDQQHSFQSSQLRSKSRTPQQTSPKFTFKPVINENSKKMIENNMENDQNPRWERLYDQQKYQQEKREDIIRKVEEINQKMIEEQCTFKPQIDKTSKVYQYQNNENGDLFERNLAWYLNKAQKIQILNDQIKQEELQVCTFQPQIDKKSIDEIVQADYSQLNTKSIEKFLERCNYAKQLKLEQELKELRVSGQGSKWKNQLTKPKGPAFMEKYYEDMNEAKIKSQSPQKPTKSPRSKPKKDQKSILKQKVKKHLQEENSEDDEQYIDQRDSRKNDDKLLSTIPEIDTQQEQSKNTTQVYNDQFVQQQQQQQLQQMSQFQNDNMSSRFDQQQLYNQSSSSYIGSQSMISNTSKSFSNYPENVQDGVEYQSAMNFLHDQLHQIDFSFDQ